ncbi:MAG: hypothetical protein IID46_10355, partial [Planctomycetes bacterium]|nr:hypothetical protein [Planctomycetota bacterium]
MFNRRSALCVGIPLLCMGILFAYTSSLKKTEPVIPHPNLKGAHKSVVQVVESAYEGVQNNPSSGEDWGYLGMVLMAHHL